jgi:nucleoside-diphosphate-sugar epimerase
MAIFLTGSTGYLGSYLAAGLLTGHADKLNRKRWSGSGDRSSFISIFRNSLRT